MDNRNAVGAPTADGKSRKKDKETAEDDTIDKVAKKQKTAPEDQELPPNKPKTPTSTSAAPLPNSLFVANLSGQVNYDELEKFFEDAGGITHIQFDTFDDGSSKGFARVEFATAEAVEKACALNGHLLMGEPVKINYGHKQRILSSGSRDNSSFKKPRNFSKNTVLIRGFDSAYEAKLMQSFLRVHFGHCNFDDKSITRVSVQKDTLTGANEGVAFMEFSHPDCVPRALEKNGSALLSFALTVQELEHEEDDEPGSPLPVGSATVVPVTPLVHRHIPSTGTRTVFTDDD